MTIRFEELPPTMSTPEPCKHCGVATFRLCPACKGPYCIMDASPIDPTMCRLCQPSVNIELLSEPLLDEDGVRHCGRHMIPVGSAYKTLPKAITEMDDYTLGGYIAQMEVYVRQAEQQLDYRRIALGTAKLEHAERGEAERRRLRGVRVVSAGSRTISSAAKGTQVNKAGKAAIAGVVEKLALAGIKTPEDMAKFMSFLAKNNGVPQTTPQVPPSGTTALSSAGKAPPGPGSPVVQQPVVVRGVSPPQVEIGGVSTPEQIAASARDAEIESLFNEVTLPEDSNGRVITQNGTELTDDDIPF